MSIGKATVTSKGQMTIPVAIRRALGLRAGDHVLIELRSDEAVLRKAGSAADLRGSVAPREVTWDSARKRAWRARAQRAARSSATRTSSYGS
ncbi:MAG TPA: AbrB/MazE/SpoVT family DNA-binding domain-containing protein [Actinomycetota bacterium]